MELQPLHTKIDKSMQSPLGTIVLENSSGFPRAESNLYRTWNAQIIGMTAMPEIRLAREAGLCYATVAMVTDYDVWHENETPVTVEMVIQTLLSNAAVAKQAVLNAIRALETVGASPQAGALRDAIITNRDVAPAQVIKRLDLLVGKYFHQA